MERALHPELAKRMISTDPKTGRSQFDHMGAMALVQRTRDGGGKKTPPERQLKEITILDRYNNAAIVKIVASDWIDYLEVAKFNGDWKIINVLWELKHKPQSVESNAPVQRPRVLRATLPVGARRIRSNPLLAPCSRSCGFILASSCSSRS